MEKYTMLIGIPHQALLILRGVLVSILLVILAAIMANAEPVVLKQTVPVLPAVINAAAFRAGGEGIGYHWPRTKHVRIIDSTDATGDAKGGDKVVCGIRNGWLLYDIEAAEASTYTFTLRTATLLAGLTIRLELDGQVADTVAVPKTGSWNRFIDVTSKPVKVAAGMHALKVIWAETTGIKYRLPRLRYIAIAESKPCAIRINAGDYMDYTDSEGNVWQPDTGFEGGECVERGEGVIIPNTKDVRIYRTEHFGMSRFSVKVPNGNYIARLHFAETFDDRKAGSRIFEMNVQGVEFARFDLIGEAGGSYRALIKTIPVTVTKGEFAITFHAQNMPTVTINGIELLQADTPVVKP